MTTEPKDPLGGYEPKANAPKASDPAPVRWRGEEIPYICPLPSLGRAGAPYAYNIDPGAGSAMDRLQRDWPHRAQVNDLRRRDGRVTPLYPATPDPLPVSREAVIAVLRRAWNAGYDQKPFGVENEADAILALTGETSRE